MRDRFKARRLGVPTGPNPGVIVHRRRAVRTIPLMTGCEILAGVAVFACPVRDSVCLPPEYRHLCGGFVSGRPASDPT